MSTIKELKELYENGTNISAFLRSEMELSHNNKDIIELVYELQTGSYIEGMKNGDLVKHKIDYADEIAKVVGKLCQPQTILEAGIGEATTLSWVVAALSTLNISPQFYGFDLSCSRVFYARKWLEQQKIIGVHLCTGDLANMPYQDNSIDLVYTSHSIEPNGGNEETILKELYRVAKKYVILLEPGYELSSINIRKRMDSHGYCKNLKSISESLGYTVLSHELFRYTRNVDNPTAITIIEKPEIAIETSNNCGTSVYACPKFKTPLKELGGMLYSPEAGLVYPILKDIPCLRIENGVLATKFDEFF